jgi:hypothetical protein
MSMDLIYCAGGNHRLMDIAHDAGFLLGVRSDKCDYDMPIAFVDIEYRQPDWERHLRRVGELQPRYAIVPDLSDRYVDARDIERAVCQAHQLANYCEIPLIVPKLPGQITLFPDYLAIAYSVPTSYGGAHYGLHELANRRVHLLGGSPKAQQLIARWVKQYNATVISADGNMAQLMATKLARFWQRRWVDHPRRGTNEHDLYLDCWRLSCQNIALEWSTQ